MSGCLNAGYVRSNNSDVGGIVGYSSFGTVANCANTGTVTAYNFNIVTQPNTQKNAGGILGNCSAATVTDCVNFGTVTCDKDQAGGIVGYMTVSSEVGSLTRCLNAGSVSGGNNFLCGAIMGNTVTSAATRMTNFSACLYDNQMISTTQLAANGVTAGMEGIVPVTTTALTGSATLDLLNTWSFAEGRYPLPQALVNNSDVLAAAATFIQLPITPDVQQLDEVTVGGVAEGQDANWVSSAATLNSASGLSMSLPEGNSLFIISGRTLTPNPGAGMGAVAVELTNGSFKRQVVFTTFTVPFSGNGTDSSPFMLRTKADWKIQSGLTPCASLD